MASSWRRGGLAVSLSLVALLLVTSSTRAAATVTHLPESTSTFSVVVANPSTGDLGLYTATTTTNATVVENDNHFTFSSRSLVTESFQAFDPAAASSDHGHGVRHSIFIDNHPGADPFSGTTIDTLVATDVFNVPGGGVVVLRSVFHVVITGGEATVQFDHVDTVCNAH